LELQEQSSRIRKTTIRICSILLPREACEAIPWRQLAEILGIDFLLIFSFMFIIPFALYLTSLKLPYELPLYLPITLVFSLFLTIPLYLIDLLFRFLILTYTFNEYFRKLRSILPITSTENFRLTLRSVYLSQINASFRLTILIIILLIGSFIVHEIVPTIQGFATYVIVPALGLIAGSAVIRIHLVVYPHAVTGEYEVKLDVKRGERGSKSKTPVIFIRALTSKKGRPALLAFIKNPLKQELVVEGRAYSIPPYENGRVLLSEVSSGISQKRSFVIIPPHGTVELELHLKAEALARNNHTWGKGGFFALIHLRFVHYQRSGRLTALFKTLLGMPVEELHKERNVVLVCYLNPQDGRAEIIYELPGRLPTPVSQ